MSHGRESFLFTTDCFLPSLPRDIQQAVCNKDIRLDNYLYNGWDDGSWYVHDSYTNSELLLIDLCMHIGRF